ncbi:MAG: hypothetical protein AAGU10_15435 [Methanosarcina mazei]|uniref:hypothetical protein n=1 Tax=Methanosarcina soligelidi TaxID=1036677 RepID=UPI001269577E|nr:hypothetical protein [Methanosarcina soligelidi]
MESTSDIEKRFIEFKNIWFIIASLSYIAAIGFIIAYFVGGYSPYIAIAVMWACTGSLDMILGILSRKKKNNR